MLTIRLLGRPALERDGRPAASPRGRKAWALLGYVLLAERPAGRRHLAELLFSEADDPLGALRWTLGELRRALGGAVEITGDPVVATLGAGVTVDVWDGPGEPGRGELLEGIELPSNLEFESWLTVARHRVSATVEARLREAANAALATGRAADAVHHAAAAVARNPLDESNHELLVRSLATAGDRTAALRQVAVCEDILRREVGLEVSAALREAANVGVGTPIAPPVGGRAAAASQLEAGRAAIVAGAVDAGLQSLRRAVSEAARWGDDALRGRALVALGSALVHAVRGRDGEGAVVLHEAIDLTTRAGDATAAATAHRELGFVEVQAGRRATAEAWLVKAQGLADTDDELAAVLGVRGMNASDRGDYAAALDHFGGSVERAARCGDHRQQAWSLALLARVHLLRDERSQAAVGLTQSLGLVREHRWMAFLPFPQALQAELELRAGDEDGAAERFEQAWVLGCQIEDPCWQAMAARGLGLVHSGRGDDAAATRWFDQALAHCTRVTDRYQWVHAYVLDAAIGMALARDDVDRARPLVTALASLAARCDMREMVVRAHLHRHRLGDGPALAVARLLSEDIDNPALAGLLQPTPTGRTR